MKGFIMIFLINVFLVLNVHCQIDKLTRNSNWDPEDPNCPCYKIQKLADKEYQKMLKLKEKPESKTGVEKIWDANGNRSKLRKSISIKKRKRNRYSGKAICPVF